jgi:peptidyl-tRNA hydrolase, PTH1 family
MTWLVAGLGNPGQRYAGTRHNLGRRAAEELAERSRERFRKVRFVPVDVAELKHAGETVLLVRSHAYMNDSGPGFASLARKRDISPERVIAVHDEIDLAFGALRVKFGGSTAGHNGLNSLVGAMRTADFYRVRLGVGRPRGRMESADWVLEDFSKRERPEAEILVADGADAVLSLIADGLASTQDRFNRPSPRA